MASSSYDVQTQRSCGSPPINRLRMLNQLDNELNLLYRILISRRVMSHSEDLLLLTPEQWGGREGKQCVDLALNVELLLTIIHLSRTNASMTDVDASACFDRIAPALMYLAYSKGGASRNTINLLGKALLRSRYFPTTSHGVSNRFNTHSPSSTFCGPGQDSCDCTPSWIQTCNPCLLTYKKNANRLEIKDPTGKMITDGTI